MVHLNDVTRVEIGGEDYTVTVDLSNHPAVGTVVTVTLGANVLNTTTLMESEIAEFQHRMP